LTRTVPQARWAYVAVAIVGVAGLAAIPLFGQPSLLPSFKEPDILIQWESTPGTSQPEMNRIMARVSQELRAIPGVRDVGAHVGRAVFGDQVVDVNSAQMWVNVDQAANYDATLTAIHETVDGYPGLSHEVQTLLQRTIDQPQASAGDGITVRVFGDDPAVLRSEAEKARQTLAGISGVVDSHVELPVEEPTLEIEVDLAAAQRYGVKPGDVRRAAAILLSGLQVGALFEEQKVFDVVVWGSPQMRQSLTDIRELLIETPGGGHVRLGDVADVGITSAPTVIRRESISPYLDVAFKVQGRDLGAVASDMTHALQGITFPLEYHAELRGEYAERQAAQQSLLLAVVAAVIGIFLLLQAAYRSWRLAFAAVLTLPMALAGGLLAALLSGGAQNISLVGLLAVFGIAVRNGVALINHFRHLEEREGETFGPELVRRGARERLTPILTTTLTLALALAPFVFFGDIPGLEIVRPMAIVIMGGLVTTMALNLFVLPTLYLRFGSNHEEVMESSPEPVPST